MRITNPMITNRMLVNINRNSNTLNNYYTQISTGKKIQFASENPIIAARALKFRTSITETQQYQKNASQAISWMEITEEGFGSVEKITKKIQELLVQGASDTYVETDRKMIINDIASLVEQMGQEMNITYGGRYVFSGYRTDKPPVITNPDPNASYEIKQSFSLKDLEETQGYFKLDNVTMPEINNIKILKLPYTNITSINDATSSVTTKSLAVDGALCYQPAANDIFYIKETGELVLGANKVNALKTGSLDFTYKIKGLNKNDLNPELYFDCKNLVTGKSFDMKNQSISYEFGVSTRIGINTLAKDVYSDKMYGDLREFSRIVSSVELSDRASLITKYHVGIVTLEEATKLADEQLVKEEQAIQGLLQDRFSDMIEIMKNHDKRVSKERADLGTRMARLELIENRLEEEELSYSSLMSENEDADYMEVIMFLQNAKSIYEASLQMGANIVQISLANFIR